MSFRTGNQLQIKNGFILTKRLAKHLFCDWAIPPEKN